jgi:hypothetical protein
MFQRRKTYGPRISLTELQEDRLITRCNAGGLTCFVDQCHTGSVYVSIGLPQWHQNIDGEWYDDLDCGCGDDIAKIRLSGHDEGVRTDSTHNAVGTKSECMAALNRWITELINKHGPAGQDILASGPPVPSDA